MKKSLSKWSKDGLKRVKNDLFKSGIFLIIYKKVTDSMVEVVSCKRVEIKGTQKTFEEACLKYL